MNVSTRLIRAGLAVAATVAVSACGTEREITVGSSPTTGPTTTVAPGPAVWDGTASPDTVLLQVGTEQPHLLIAGDGTLYRTLGGNEVAAGFAARIAPPAPVATPMVTAKVTAEGLALIHQRADELGLFEDPGEYEWSGVTDTLGTSLSLTDSRGTFRHSTDLPLAPSEERDPKRRAFAQFMVDLRDLQKLTNDGVGPERPFLPEKFIVSIERSYTTSGTNDWPKQVPIQEGCVSLPVDEFPQGPLGRFGTTTGNDIVVVPVLPGVRCDDGSAAVSGWVISLTTDASSGPSFALLADGTFYATGDPTKAGFASVRPPEQAVPGPLVTGLIPADGMARIWEAAEQRNLLRHLDEKDYGWVSDSETTTLSLVHDGTEYVHRAAGLRLMDSPERTALIEMIDDLTHGLDQLTGVTIDSTPYEPNTYNVRNLGQMNESHLGKVGIWPEGEPLGPNCVPADRVEAPGLYLLDSQVFAVYPSIPGDFCS